MVLHNCSGHWDYLGNYLNTNASHGKLGVYNYGKNCVEINISKGMSNQINLEAGDFQ